MIKLLAGVLLIVADIVTVKAEMIARHATVHGHPASSSGVLIVAALALAGNAVIWSWILRGAKRPAQTAGQRSYVPGRPR